MGNDYLYNGNEEQDELSLDLMDFNARFYDNRLGRFISVDPQADVPEQLSQSPYQYGWNNPIKLNDPNGENPCPTCDPMFTAGTVIGAGKSLWNTIKGAAKMMYNMSNTSGQVEMAVNTAMTAQAIADDPSAVVDAVSEGVSKTVDTIVNGTSYERGELFGSALVAVADVAVGTKGAGTAGKLLKTGDKISDVVKTAVHGNSKLSEKAQHVYGLVNNGSIEKVGISSGKISSANKSYRATSQVNKLNKEGGNYSSTILQKIPTGSAARQKALNAEKIWSNTHKRTLNPLIHKRPKVD